MAEAVLSLGGNLGDVRETLAHAVNLVCDGTAACLVARSSDYSTPPWGDPDQPDFVNLCLIVSTTLTPQNLLAHMHAVERALGRDRTRERHWGPRPVDIDLIDYDGVELYEDGLVLPHPGALSRAFVLVPLAEIAPQRTIAGVPVGEALARVDASGVTQLPHDTPPARPREGGDPATKSAGFPLARE